ncbi:hypothetical protein [Kribbella sp. CA-294648]|uniref:hypothetical protein n=1 Tax=Kribbella sp. CA-294648 TaxID=3239948 RepID=UPI003D8D283B
MSENTATGIGNCMVHASTETERRQVMDTVVATVRELHQRTAASEPPVAEGDVPR